MRWLALLAAAAACAAQAETLTVGSKRFTESYVLGELIARVAGGRREPGLGSTGVVFTALKAGARGYLTKDADPEEIARAIATVARGEALLDPSVQSRLLDALDRVEIVPPPRPDGVLPDGLTRREAEVLGLIAAGKSNADIAATLHVSEATVKSHINHIFAKTGVRDRAQAVTWAYRTGLVRP